MPFDSKEKFIIYFNNGTDLLVRNMIEVITPSLIMDRYNESRLNVNGYRFEDLFINSMFSAHTHPPTYNNSHKRPSDGDYDILKNFKSLHYVIDETFIYCISFLIDSVNGFYGKWNWENGTPIYVSDEHFDLNTIEKYQSEIPNERQLSNDSGFIESGIFEIHKDGTIRLESNI